MPACMHTPPLQNRSHSSLSPDSSVVLRSLYTPALDKANTSALPEVVQFRAGDLAGSGTAVEDLIAYSLRLVLPRDFAEVLLQVLRSCASTRPSTQYQHTIGRQVCRSSGGIVPHKAVSICRVKPSKSHERLNLAAAFGQ